MCRKEQQVALGYGRVGMPGRFVPECQPDGRYDPVQCDGGSGYCWCVDKYGVEIHSTRRRGMPPCAMMGKSIPRIHVSGKALAFLGIYVSKKLERPALELTERSLLQSPIAISVINQVAPHLENDFQELLII